MTVEDLIQLLEGYPPFAPVFLYDRESDKGFGVDRVDVEDGFVREKDGYAVFDWLGSRKLALNEGEIKEEVVMLKSGGARYQEI